MPKSLQHAKSGLATAVSRRGASPIYRQIYDRVRRGIATGAYQPGSRLPSARGLAGELGVARGTIEDAYGLLLAEGYIERRGQAGSVISRLAAEGGGAPRLVAPMSRRPEQPREPQPAPQRMSPFQLGQPAFDARMKELEGTPVIVNKWASWCGPCQAEFPIFQAATLTHGKEVGFIGLNTGDKDPAAKRFLATRPLPFPSYTDPESEIAYDRQIAAGFPMTQFIGRDGEVAYTHTGPYTSQDQLDEDIEKYLG